MLLKQILHFEIHFDRNSDLESPKNVSKVTCPLGHCVTGVMEIVYTVTLCHWCHGNSVLSNIAKYICGLTKSFNLTANLVQG